MQCRVAQWLLCPPAHTYASYGQSCLCASVLEHHNFNLCARACTRTISNAHALKCSCHLVSSGAPSGHGAGLCCLHHFGNARSIVDRQRVASATSVWTETPAERDAIYRLKSNGQKCFTSLRRAAAPRLAAQCLPGRIQSPFSNPTALRRHCGALGARPHGCPFAWVTYGAGTGCCVHGCGFSTVPAGHCCVASNSCCWTAAGRRQRSASALLLAIGLGLLLVDVWSGACEALWGASC